jgi:predicted deacylase
MNRLSIDVHSSEVLLPAGSIMPVVSIDTNIAGPIVVVTSNVHGDEPTGIGIVHNLVRCLPGLLSSGAVHMYPTLNPGGLAAATRVLPDDGQDLNRAFPGQSRGMASSRHAHCVWTDILSRSLTVLIDLHTDVTGAIPYAITDRVLDMRNRRKLSSTCQRLALASGLTTLREYPRDRYQRFSLDRSLSGAMVNREGIPAVTLEVGPRNRLDPQAIAVGTSAVLGVLTELGLVDVPAQAHPSQKNGGPWRRESGPRTNHTGVLIPRVRSGDTLERGRVMAEVRTIRGDVLETLSARSKGFVVALADRAHVVPGVSCATIAVRDR